MLFVTRFASGCHRKIILLQNILFRHAQTGLKLRSRAGHRDPGLAAASNSVRKVCTVHLPGQEVAGCRICFDIFSYAALFLLEYPARRRMIITAVLLTKTAFSQSFRRPSRIACRTGDSPWMSSPCFRTETLAEASLFSEASVTQCAGCSILLTKVAFGKRCPSMSECRPVCQYTRQRHYSLLTKFHLGKRCFARRRHRWPELCPCVNFRIEKFLRIPSSYLNPPAVQNTVRDAKEVLSWTLRISSSRYSVFRDENITPLPCAS